MPTPPFGRDSIQPGQDERWVGSSTSAAQPCTTTTCTCLAMDKTSFLVCLLTPSLFFRMGFRSARLPVAWTPRTVCMPSNPDVKRDMMTNGCNGAE